MNKKDGLLKRRRLTVSAGAMELVEVWVDLGRGAALWTTTASTLTIKLLQKFGEMGCLTSRKAAASRKNQISMGSRRAIMKAWGQLWLSNLTT